VSCHTPTDRRMSLNELLFLREQKKQPVGYVINGVTTRACARFICTRGASRRVLGSWQIRLRFHWHLPQTTDINRRIIYLRANNVKTIKERSRERRRTVPKPFDAMISLRELFHSCRPAGIRGKKEGKEGRRKGENTLTRERVYL